MLCSSASRYSLHIQNIDTTKETVTRTRSILAVSETAFASEALYKMAEVYRLLFLSYWQRPPKHRSDGICSICIFDEHLYRIRTVTGALEILLWAHHISSPTLEPVVGQETEAPRDHAPNTTVSNQQPGMQWETPSAFSYWHRTADGCCSFARRYIPRRDCPTQIFIAPLCTKWTSSLFGPLRPPGCRNLECLRMHEQNIWNHLESKAWKDE